LSEVYESAVVTEGQLCLAGIIDRRRAVGRSEHIVVFNIFESQSVLVPLDIEQTCNVPAVVFCIDRHAEILSRLTAYSDIVSR